MLVGSEVGGGRTLGPVVRTSVLQQGERPRRDLQIIVAGLGIAWVQSNMDVPCAYNQQTLDLDESGGTYRSAVRGSVPSERR